MKSICTEEEGNVHTITAENELEACVLAALAHNYFKCSERPIRSTDLNYSVRCFAEGTSVIREVVGVSASDPFDLDAGFSGRSVVDITTTQSAAPFLFDFSAQSLALEFGDGRKVYVPSSNHHAVIAGEVLS